MKNETLIYILLDKTGSMTGTEVETISGVNYLLQEQKDYGGEAKIKIVQFDTSYSTLIHLSDIYQIQPLDVHKYRPNGFTAYYDAIGANIVELGQYLEKLPEWERPSKVIFAVITDGEDNRSREYRPASVAEMVRHQQDKYNWSFVFLGATLAAIDDAQVLGIGDIVYNPGYGISGDETFRALQSFSSRVARLR
jgi:uncharacterized protein YegL